MRSRRKNKTCTKQRMIPDLICHFYYYRATYYSCCVFLVLVLSAAVLVIVIESVNIVVSMTITSTISINRD